jgi:hypothetical protein
MRADLMAEAEAQAHQALGDAPVASGAAADDLTRATQKLAGSGRPPAEQAGFLGVALLLNFALTWVRGEVRDLVESIHLERIWAWLETGGVFAALALLAMAPAIGLFFVIVLTLGAVGVWVFAKGAAAVADAARRRQCPDCKAQIRVEAQRCRYCQTEVTPLRWLDESQPEPATLVLAGPPET